jgi:hypothetical protein
MQGKKSFTAYCDWIDLFETLSDEELGKLTRHIFRYVNDLNPEPPDRLTLLLFAPIKSTLKRDLQRWLLKAEVNKNNGSKGGRPKKTQQNPTKPNGFLENPNNPEKPVSVSVRVSDSVKVKEIKEEYTHPLILFAKENAPDVMKMKAPLTNELCDKLATIYGIEKVKHILTQMHNKNDLLKKYKSAYLTANDWLKRDKKDAPKTGLNLINKLN